MADLWVGIVALALGAVVCFRGRLAVRAIMAIWGGLVGFGLGAAIAAAVTGEGFLTGPIGWIVAILAALLFARLAYGFYVLGVVIAVGSLGYGLGTAAGTLSGLTGAALFLTGAVGAVLLVMVALAANLPGLLLTVLSAVAGASWMVGGLMVLLGAVDARVLTVLGLPMAIGTARGWNLLFVAMAIAGFVVQSRGGSWRSGRSGWVGHRTPPLARAGSAS